ncbi:MAG: hypothetical protein ACOVNQ_08370 [Pirellula sp.]
MHVAPRDHRTIACQGWIERDRLDGSRDISLEDSSPGTEGFLKDASEGESVVFEEASVD